MSEAIAVIGAMFGDEGKGLMTDYFANTTKNSIIVRYNGGAQAAHTVDLGNERSHVFGHIGSGAFNNAPTYLSEYFVVNPRLLIKELIQFGFPALIYVDENCIVTTPYDVLINQTIEASRGHGKHGSCGVGFNETIERNLSPDYKIKVKDLNDIGKVFKILEDIRTIYVPKRLKDLGISIDLSKNEFLNNSHCSSMFLGDIKEFLLHTIIQDDSILNNFENVIFEGAQGLLLDEDHEWFPHVTRSKTGLHNIVKICEKVGIKYLKPVYVTRCYMTRHGAGPMPNEIFGRSKPYKMIEEKTNVPNRFQDHMRYGFLDLDVLSSTIKSDIEKNKSELVDINPVLAVTCIDQVFLEGRVKYYHHGQLHSNEVEKFLEDIFEVNKIRYGYVSKGPTRKTISKWMKPFKTSEKFIDELDTFKLSPTFKWE